MKFILGQKVGMSRVFQGEKAIPVTLVLAGPCAVTQVKTAEKDGYQAVQLSWGSKKKTTKPLIGHLKKAKQKSTRYLREFRADDSADYKVGQEIDVSIFKLGDKVKATAVSKGKGFTGVVKRHGFAGSPKTHGHRHDERAPGSIGAGFPQHVFKGMKMAGRSGHTQVSIKNLEVVAIDKEKNLLALQGSLPGSRNTLLEIQAPGQAETSDEKTDDKAKDKTKDEKKK